MIFPAHIRFVMLAVFGMLPCLAKDADPVAAKSRLKLLMLSCGNNDGLFRINKGVQTYLKEKDVPHVWHVDGNGHDPTHWSNSLYYFTQKIFR